MYPFLLYNLVTCLITAQCFHPFFSKVCLMLQLPNRVDRKELNTIVQILKVNVHTCHKIQLYYLSDMSTFLMVL